MWKITGMLEFYTSPSWPESTATFSAEGPPSESEFKATYHIAMALQVATAMISYGLEQCIGHKSAT